MCCLEAMALRDIHTVRCTDNADNTLNANHSYLLCAAKSRRKKTHCVAAVGLIVLPLVE